MVLVGVLDVVVMVDGGMALVALVALVWVVGITLVVMSDAVGCVSSVGVFVVMLGFVMAVVVVVSTSVVLESVMALVVLVLVVVVAVSLVVRSACVFGDLGILVVMLVSNGLLTDESIFPEFVFFCFRFLISRERPECVLCTHDMPRGARTAHLTITPRCPET